MPFSTTILFYLLIGAATAVAVFVSESSSRSRIGQSLMAVLFWPILLPMLLSAPGRNSDESFASRPDTTPKADPHDAMSAAISQVESELDAALQSLDGWSEGMLTREADRICELKSAWGVQAGRIRELDRLLIQPGFSEKPEPATEESQSPLDERILSADKTRQANIRRLREMRRQMHSDLMGTLAWVRELVTMIHLAKYGGAPASRAEELIAQIAAAVEGLSEVTAWTPDDGVRVDSASGVAV
jgi:hypothetical protein